MNYENSEKLKSMKAIIRKKMLDVRRKTIDNTHKLFVLSLLSIVSLISASYTSQAQVLRLDSVLSVIKERNPMLQDFRQRANAMNAYSAGSTSWMAPEVGGGLWMMPYKKVEDPSDKGQIMLS